MIERLGGKNVGVGILTLNRPAARNALSLDMLARLSAAIAELSSDRSIKSVWLRPTAPPSVPVTTSKN